MKVIKNIVNWWKLRKFRKQNVSRFLYYLIEFNSPRSWDYNIRRDSNRTIYKIRNVK